MVSTEAQCCVAALSRIKPGDLFAKNGTRTNRACSSGTPNCLWDGDEKAKLWHDFMQDLANDRGKGEMKDIYLNAGLIAGKAHDLISIFEALNIREDEDDQAVLTDFMYRNPNLFALDYDQSMFGNNRWQLGTDGCMFHFPFYANDTDNTSLIGRQLEHVETGTSPLFIHSPGPSKECHHKLLFELKAQRHRGLKQKSEDQMKHSDKDQTEKKATDENSRMLLNYGRLLET